MGNIKTWTGVAAGSTLLLLLLAVPAVQAQVDPYFQVRPGLTQQQYQNALAIYGRGGGMTSPYTFGYGYGFGPYAGYSGVPASYRSMYSAPLGSSTATMTSTPNAGYAPYNPGSYYANPYLYDPYGSSLRGGADVIDAQGRYLNALQQANLLREQVRAERLANRKRAFEDYMYMKERTPTLEQERARSQAQTWERSRNDPPVTEIWSGKALNDILGELRALKDTGRLVASRAPNLPLEEDLLKHINLTGKEGGNLGLLKNEGRFTWPVAIQTEESKKARERLGELTQAAIEQAKFKNSVDNGTIRQIETDVEGLHKLLSKNVGDLPAAQYIEARRFLNSFDDAVRVLRGPTPGSYVNRKWPAKVKNVDELVKYMFETGLQFAPAVAGEEAAYVALHRALAMFDNAMQTQVAAEPPK